MLALLRRLAPLVLLLLTTLVAAERTDLLPCADAACTTSVPDGAAPLPALPDAGAHGCLCHAVFAPPPRLEVAGASVTPLRRVIPDVLPPPARGTAPPAPVPLA